jgi:hypothetical protein
LQGSTSSLLRICLVALIGSGACVRKGRDTTIPFELEQNDILIVVRTAGNVSDAPPLDVAHTVADGREITLPLTVSDGQRLLLYHLRYRDLQRASGTLTDNELRAVKVRLAGDESEFEGALQDCDIERGQCEGGCPDLACKNVCRETARVCREGAGSKAGNCGRCLVPATSSPQIVNNGDSCAIPTFAGARIFRESGGALEVSTAPEDVTVLENTTALIRIDWTGACDCTAGAGAQSLDNLAIEPISPPESVWAFEHFAENKNGIIGSARDRAAVTFDRVNPPRIITFPDIDADARAFTALGTGDFLLASERSTETLGQGYLFSLLRYRDGALAPPEPVGGSLIARPSRMKYLGNGPNSLYLLGAKPGAVVQLDAAIFACSDEPFSCSAVSIDSCAGETNGLFVRDAQMLDNGVGIAHGFRAVYLKPPGSAAPNPSPNDVWSCSVFSPDTLYANTKGESIRLNGLRALGKIGNRSFFCSVRDAPPCEPSYPVVLSAVVTATATEQPVWTIEAEADNSTDCRAIFAVPGQPDRVRALFSNGRTIDFDGGGNEVARSTIGGMFDSGVRWHEILQLASGDLLARTRYNGAYVSDGMNKFERIYGPAEFHDGDYRILVPLPGGGFVAFGTNREITRIRPTADEGSKVSYLSDPSGYYRSTDIIRDAVLDTASTNPQRTVILGVGYGDYPGDQGGRKPLIRRYFLDPDAMTIINAEDVPIPESFVRITPRGNTQQLSIDGVAEIGNGQFVAYAQDTRLLRIIGNEQVVEIPMDWDAIDTPTNFEMPPTLDADRCNPNAEPRLDAFRDIDGKGGVAWVVGTNGLIVRVVGDHVDRFMPRVRSGSGFDVASGAELRSVRASCPDRAMVTGVFENPNDTLGRTFRAFSIGPQPEEEECFPRASGQASDSMFGVFELADSGSCVSFNTSDAPYQTPNVILPTTAGAAMIFADGAIIHAGGAQQGPRLKVPFSVLSALDDGAGFVLFGGYEGRLAIGTSR